VSRLQFPATRRAETAQRIDSIEQMLVIASLIFYVR
jgi:hypothetical protein